MREEYWTFERFVKVVRIVEYGTMPTKAVQGPMGKRTILISSRVVKVVRIIEYGPVPAKAVREQIHK